MAVWTNPTLHASGDTLAVTDWNAVAGNTTFLYQAPYAISTTTTATSLTANTQTTVPITAKTSNYGFTISGSGMAVPLTGIYHTDFSCADGDSSGAFVTPYLYINAASALIGQAGQSANTGFGAIGNGSGVLSLSSGAVATLVALQTNGSAQTSINDSRATYVHLFFIGSA